MVTYIEFVTEDEDGEEVVHRLPAQYEVCRRCRGAGKHVNPAVDGHGITAEEWEDDWDDDSREGYMSGRYDVQCEECGGERVTMVVDEGACDPETLEKYFRDRADREREEADDRRVRRMESGGYDY
jgi:hypothetical protein